MERNMLTYIKNKISIAFSSIFDIEHNFMRSVKFVLMIQSIMIFFGYKAKTWQPGEKFRILFVGYNGTRNTGSDMRVHEMISQIQSMFGSDNLDLAVATLNVKLTSGYFNGIKQIYINKILFPFYFLKHIHNYHCVIACEGSMFKKKFSTMLTVYNVCALALANKLHIPSIGYGADADVMTPELCKFVSKLCNNSYVITRNEESLQLLKNLGIHGDVGTDTAWTLDVSKAKIPDKVQKIIRAHNDKKILVVCPINPYWWPVQPSISMFIKDKLTACYQHIHYGSIYYHFEDETSKNNYQQYLSAFANGIKQFLKKNDFQLIIVGMEQLDRKACEDLAKLIGGVTTICVSDEYNMFEIIGILSRCDLLISSRFHAIVTSMPMLIPSIGVSMDERIDLIMKARNHSRYLLKTNAVNLSQEVDRALHDAYENRQEVSHEIAICFANEVSKLYQMGEHLVKEIQRFYPEIKMQNAGKNYREYLEQSVVASRSRQNNSKDLNLE